LEISNNDSRGDVEDFQFLNFEVTDSK
jgi:hypothetical protein